VTLCTPADRAEFVAGPHESEQRRQRAYKAGHPPLVFLAVLGQVLVEL